MKRKLSLFLAVVFAVGLLAGCGQQEASSSGDSGEAAPEKAEVYMMPVDAQTYWTAKSGSGEVSLRDGRTEGTLDLVIVQDGQETAARILTQGEDYEDPSTLSATDFSDLMGCDGFVLTHISADSGQEDSWYYTVESDELVCIGDSFGNGTMTGDYLLDLDGDGEMELVCNCIYHADGVENVRVFHRLADGSVEEGTLVTTDAPKSALSTAGAVWSEYDPEEGEFLLHVSGDDGDEVFQYPADMSCLAFSPYAPVEPGRAA